MGPRIALEHIRRTKRLGALSRSLFLSETVSDSLGQLKVPLLFWPALSFRANSTVIFVGTCREQREAQVRGQRSTAVMGYSFLMPSHLHGSELELRASDFEARPE